MCDTKKMDSCRVNVFIDGLGDAGVVKADLVYFELREGGDDEDDEGY